VVFLPLCLESGWREIAQLSLVLIVPISRSVRTLVSVITPCTRPDARWHSLSHGLNLSRGKAYANQAPRLLGVSLCLLFGFFSALRELGLVMGGNNANCISVTAMQFAQQAQTILPSYSVSLHNGLEKARTRRAIWCWL
jgi:hypothetical protein